MQALYFYYPKSKLHIATIILLLTQKKSRHLQRLKPSDRRKTGSYRWSSYPTHRWGQYQGCYLRGFAVATFVVARGRYNARRAPWAAWARAWGALAWRCCCAATGARRAAAASWVGVGFGAGWRAAAVTGDWRRRVGCAPHRYSSVCSSGSAVAVAAAADSCSLPCLEDINSA